MAGGTFTSQNKIRPGVYLKFEGVPTSDSLLGTRGIVTFAAPLEWGDEEELIKITVDDLYNANLEKLIGTNIYNEKSKLVKAALENAHTLLLKRGNVGGEKAKLDLTIGTDINLAIEAKYSGTIGNTISVIISETTGTNYTVSTYLGNTLKDTQYVKNINELVENDFVTFSGAGVIANTTVNTLLTGGTDGSFSTSDYTQYLTTIKHKEFDTLAAYNFGNTSLFTGAEITAFIKEMRETRGMRCQAVINDYNQANYEGIISTYKQGITYNDGIKLDEKEFVIWVAGATAGADVNESNTYKIVSNATSIDSTVQEDDIESLILQGYLLISLRRDGAIVIEKDINTLTVYTDNQKDAFKDNKVIRLLDTVANYIANDFEQNYIGKVVNDDTGRALCKTSIISYLTSIQTSGAITNFDSTTDVNVVQGDNPDAYYAEISIQPTYSVDKLYLVINVK